MSTVGVTVPDPVAINSFGATPGSITRGQSSTLSWSTGNAAYCGITPDGSEVAVNGSKSVTPTATTTYTLYCRNAVSTSTLEWQTSNAASCSIDNGVGAVSPADSGSKAVSPAATTTYTLNCSGKGGDTASKSTTVSVQPPSYLVSASFSQLSYTVSTSADSGGSLSPSSKTVSYGGMASFTVTPNTGYEIASVTGCNGSLSGTTYTTGAITAACTVSASFSQLSYTVGTSAGSGGSLSPASQTVSHGGATTFTVTPNTGYQIASVSGCNGSLSGTTYTTGAITAASTVSASFSQSPLPSGAEEVTYLHTDTLGSVIGESKADGSFVRYHYQPYGQRLEGIPDKLGYTGHRHEGELGLTDMQARYYDPVLGRFYANDPLDYVTGNIQSFNRYAYATNNPYRYRDPDGRWIEDLVIGVPSLAAGVVSLVENVSAGNAAAAAVDAAGIVADVAAIATPGVPGGAGLSIKAARGLDVAKDAMQRGREAEKRVLASMGESKNTQIIEAGGKKTIPTSRMLSRLEKLKILNE